MTTETLERPVAASAVDLDLDIRIVTAGPVWVARSGLSTTARGRGVAVASPVLARLRPGAGQIRRLVMALSQYLVRMRGRATPFGAFAGVTALRFGQEVSVRWTDCYQARTRADAVWLADMIARLESCVALRRRLPVMANDLVLVRGERLAACIPPALTAVSLTDLACALLGSRPAGMRWPIDHADPAARVAIRDRDVLRQAVTLAGLDVATTYSCCRTRRTGAPYAPHPIGWGRDVTWRHFLTEVPRRGMTAPRHR